MKINFLTDSFKKYSFTKNGHRIFLVCFLSITLVVASCSDKTSLDKSVINNNNVTPAIPVKSNVQKNINLGYVNQSKIVSNGEEYGVKVLAVRRTANGYMLDFRFKIEDVKKAQHIMQRKIKAQLTIEKNNAKLLVPVTYKMGALRQSGKNLKEGKSYFMFFANPGSHVKEGDLVTIEIAGFKAQHITVN